MAGVPADSDEKYDCGIDFSIIEAIDIHTHVEVDCRGHRAYDDELVDATRAYFKMTDAPRPPSTTWPTTTAQPRRGGGVHHRRRNGYGTCTNSVEDLIAGAVRNNDVLIPFGTVDPWKTDAVARVRELVDRHGVRGFKFHPSMQAFEPNDRRFYPIYDAITAAGVPALFHTGQTGIGSGLPGGHGIKLRYSDPMLLDDVAADFPDLTIVLAHPAVPWVDAQIAIAAHKAMSTSTCPATPRNTFRRNSSARSAASCAPRCCSGPTTPTSASTAGAATSTSSTSAPRLRHWSTKRTRCGSSASRDDFGRPRTKRYKRGVDVDAVRLSALSWPCRSVASSSRYGPTR